MYRSAVDALLELMVDGAKEYGGLPCRITKAVSPDSVELAANGMKYCFVEVTCENGVQYGIPAYGEEAEQLYSTSLKFCPLATFKSRR